MAGPSSLLLRTSCLVGGKSAAFVEPGCTVNIGPGVFDKDPLFVEPSAHDLHLTWNSPCRNRGDNFVPGVTVEDGEEDPRIAEGRIDIGADEFFPHLYHLRKVIPGQSIHIRLIADPGTDPARLAMSTSMVDPPRPTLFGDLYLVLPSDWREDIGPVPANGVLIYPFNVPAAWVAGEEYYFQALLGPIMDPRSELTNLMTLLVETP